MPIREAIRDQMSRYRDGLKPQDTYLSYHDATVTMEDMRCLKSDWLTDGIISFWEEFLEREEISKHESCNVVLLRPSMVFLLKEWTLDPRELLEGSGGALRHLTHASHIFCPINDNTDTSQAEGGTHWSLLVVGIQDRIAFHYDSLASCNHIPATAVHRMLERVLGFSLSFANLTDTPQQDNCMDCGVHVCWAMKHLLLRRLLLAERRTEVDMSLGGKRLNAQKLRREMYRIAESLRKRANRSVSPRAKNGEPPRIGRESGTGSG